MRVEQRLVRGLRGHPREARRHLRVEHVLDLGAEAPAQQRDVLAPGVHHHLHRGVRQHLRQRADVDALIERVDQLDAALDPVPARGSGSLDRGHRQLHEAQQRAVAALAHELGIERQAPRRACLRRELGQGGGTCIDAHTRAHGAHAIARAAGSPPLEPRSRCSRDRPGQQPQHLPACQPRLARDVLRVRTHPQRGG